MGPNSRRCYFDWDVVGWVVLEDAATVPPVPVGQAGEEPGHIGDGGQPDSVC
jgi:hypothetical protein